MSFFSLREKFSHLQTHGESNLKQLLHCDVCEYKTFRNGDLSRHKVTHVENKPDNFKCNICDYKTWIRGKLRRHIDNTHVDNPLQSLPQNAHRQSTCKERQEACLLSMCENFPY